MTSATFFITLAVALVSSVVTSAVLLLLGGYGGWLKSQQSIKRLEDDVDRVEGKITTEIKKRASLKGKKTDEYDGLIEELAKNGSQVLASAQDPASRRRAIKQKVRNAQ